MHIAIHNTRRLKLSELHQPHRGGDGLSKVYWHEHTQAELADLIPDLGVALIPTGSIEIHGPHLGVGNDILSCTRIAEEVAKILYPRTIVVNVLWVGVAPHNMTASFPGTLALTAETYLRVLREVVESLVKHGVRRIVLLNGHGGNEAPNVTLCREIRVQLYYKFGVNLEIGALSYWEAIPDEIWTEVLEVAPERRIAHGGEAETSILLAIAPNAVRMDLVKTPDPRPRPQSPFFRAWYQDEYNPDGHTDDARAASQEKGVELLRAAVQGIVDALAAFMEYRPVGTRSHPGGHRYPTP
jgi:creatinine amidohydrolase